MASPRKPAPRSTIVPGSGTGLWGILGSVRAVPYWKLTSLIESVSRPVAPVRVKTTLLSIRPNCPVTAVLPVVVSSPAEVIPY